MDITLNGRAVEIPRGVCVEDAVAALAWTRYGEGRLARLVDDPRAFWWVPATEGPGGSWRDRPAML